MHTKRLSTCLITSIAAIATICGIGTTVISAPTESVHAEEASEAALPAVWLQISPVSDRVTLEPGKEFDHSFKVSNIGSETFSFHVYASPYSVADSNYNVSFSTETNRTQITRWIKFFDSEGNLADTASFSIKPGENISVTYHVSVPEDVPAGGQYACIFAESDETEGSISGSGIKTVSRVGLIVYGRTEGDTIEEASISNLVVPSFMTSGHITFDATVKNSGNTDFEAKVAYSIKSLFGRDLANDSKSYNVLPDTERNIAMEWSEQPFMGIFKTHFVVRALEKTEMIDRIVIIFPIPMIILSIIILTLIIIWVIILIRKRRERKSRLLV